MENPKGDNRTLPISVAIFWVLLAAVAFLLSALVKAGNIFGTLKRIYLDVNPNLLLSGGIIFFAYVCIALILLRSRSPAPQGLALIFLPVAIFGFGVVVVGLAPGTQRLVDRDYVPTEARRDVARFAIPIFFKTGRHDLSRPEEDRLLQAIEILSICTPSNLLAEGFASSTRFRSDIDDIDGRCDSECQNTRLAQRRGSTVKNLVELKVGMTVKAQEWEDYEAMVSLRRLNDQKQGGGIDARIEKLNRRAVLSWDQSSCG